MRARDDVGGDQFADPIGRFGPCFDGRLDAADISLDQNGQKPPPMEICLTRLTEAALAMASLASMEPVRPFVSTNPMDSLMICMGCLW